MFQIFVFQNFLWRVPTMCRGSAWTNWTARIHLAPYLHHGTAESEELSIPYPVAFQETQTSTYFSMPPRSILLGCRLQAPLHERVRHTQSGTVHRSATGTPLKSQWRPLPALIHCMLKINIIDFIISFVICSGCNILLHSRRDRSTAHELQRTATASDLTHVPFFALNGSTESTWRKCIQMYSVG